MHFFLPAFTEAFTSPEDSKIYDVPCSSSARESHVASAATISMNTLWSGDFLPFEVKQAVDQIIRIFVEQLFDGTELKQVTLSSFSIFGAKAFDNLCGMIDFAVSR